jgi:alkylation response protein AidB-like acyl-CoA dehydrogenase
MFDALLGASAGVAGDGNAFLQPLATLTAAFVAALVGSWVGAWAALSRFKRERGFDRRLDWYQHVARTLAEVKLDIEVARTIQEDPSESEHSRGVAWGKVQQGYLRLTLVEAEAVLYAHPEVAAIVERVRDRFDDVSDASNGFDVTELPKHLDELNELVSLLDDARLGNAEIVRRELGFEKLPNRVSA